MGCWFSAVDWVGMPNGTALGAELWALRGGLKLSLDLHLQEIQVESDAGNFNDLILGKTMIAIILLAFLFLIAGD